MYFLSRSTIEVPFAISSSCSSSAGSSVSAAGGLGPFSGETCNQQDKLREKGIAENLKQCKELRTCETKLFLQNI